MRILLVTHKFPPEGEGGIQNLMYGFAENSSHDITVLTRRIDGYKQFDRNQNFDINRIKPMVGPLGLYKTLNYIVNTKSQYEMLYFSTAPYSFLGFLSRVNYAVHTHGRELNLPNNNTKNILKNILSTIGLRNADQVIAVSKWTANRAHALGADQDNTTIIHPGISKTEIQGNGATIRERYNIPQSKPLLLTVARLARRKGHKLVIKALEELDMHYLICGEGPYETEIRSVVSDLGIDDRVHFAGFVPNDELDHYYNSCDIFIMPSKHIKETGSIEGFGIVFLEANAAEKPVIGSNVGGIPSAINHGETGLVVEPEAESVKSGIEMLINNPAMAEEMGRNGKEWAQEHDIQCMSRKIDEVLLKAHADGL